MSCRCTSSIWCCSLHHVSLQKNYSFANGTDSFSGWDPHKSVVTYFHAHKYVYLACALQAMHAEIVNGQSKSCPSWTHSLEIYYGEKVIGSWLTHILEPKQNSQAKSYTYSLKTQWDDTVKSYLMPSINSLNAKRLGCFCSASTKRAAYKDLV